MKGCLAYLDADDATRAYGSIASNDLWKLQGKCMYCDHCLPCPVGIDVGVITRLLDAAKSLNRGENAPRGSGPAAAIREEYGKLDHHAEECTECGACAERCPFKVDAVGNMREAQTVFA